jgi:hypothetical protein
VQGLALEIPHRRSGFFYEGQFARTLDDSALEPLAEAIKVLPMPLC